MLGGPLGMVFNPLFRKADAKAHAVGDTAGKSLLGGVLMDDPATRPIMEYGPNVLLAVAVLMVIIAVAFLFKSHTVLAVISLALGGLAYYARYRVMQYTASPLSLKHLPL